MPVGAALGAAAIGAGASIYSSNKAAKQAKAANNANIAASQDNTDKAIAESRHTQELNLAAATEARNIILGRTDNQMTQNRGDMSPWLMAGVDALNRISDPTKVLGNFSASPDYAFRLGQGLDAVATSKSVNGLLHSGSALKAVNKYAQDTASAEFGNWWGRQQGLSDRGQQAAGTVVGANSGLQQTAAQAVAQGASNIINTNNNAASGIINAGNNNMNVVGASNSANGANAAGATIATGNAIAQGAGSIADIIARYGGSAQPQGAQGGTSSYAPAAGVEYPPY